VVTLMVTPIDAERIALAQSEGELMLTLRHPLDIAPTETPGVSKAALFSNQPKKPEAPAVTVKRRPAPAAIVPIVAVAPIVRPYTVETIRAAKRSEDKLAGVLVP
jgi:Flp pilus assembly protein CpaB